MVSNKLTFVFVIILLLSINQYNVKSSNVERDYWPNDGWLSLSYEEANINESRIEEMFNYIDIHEYAIDSVLAVKNGYLVIEEYLKSNYGPNDLHPIYSITKSVMSSLIGIAIDEGYIIGTDQKILDYFDGISVLNKADKENITIEHLLTHTSGINWSEWDVPYGSPENTYGQLTDSENWVEFILNQTLVHEPGTVHEYSTGDSHLLSAILYEATGQRTRDYAEEKLFTPLGISDNIWFLDSQGIHFGGSGLELTSPSLAKFGYLYLNNGTWNGTQIVPKEWVKNSTINSVEVDSWARYGYQWWVYPEVNSYLALGYAGQRIWINQELDLVIVFTSSLSTGAWPSFVTLAANFIMKAVEEGYDPISETSFPTVSLIFPAMILMISVELNRRKKQRKN